MFGVSWKNLEKYDVIYVKYLRVNDLNKKIVS